MQAAASNASSEFSENSETPRLMPPSGGADGSPSTTAGYVVASSCSKTSGAFSLALGKTNG